MHKNDKLIVSFGGARINKMQKFESADTLNKMFPEYSKLFIIDRKSCWYHKGIQGKSQCIETTLEYLKNIINLYTEVTFIGVSMGGYAAILFGSLLNVKRVIAFIPQTILKPSPHFNHNYLSLKEFINATTTYTIYGAKNMSGSHSVSQYNNLKNITNMKIILVDNFNLQAMRDTGDYAKILKEKIDT